MIEEQESKGSERQGREDKLKARTCVEKVDGINTTERAETRDDGRESECENESEREGERESESEKERVTKGHSSERREKYI